MCPVKGRGSWQQVAKPSPQTLGSCDTQKPLSSSELIRSLWKSGRKLHLMDPGAPGPWALLPLCCLGKGGHCPLRGVLAGETLSKCIEVGARVRRAPPTTGGDWWPGREARSLLQSPAACGSPATCRQILKPGGHMECTVRRREHTGSWEAWEEKIPGPSRRLGGGITPELGSLGVNGVGGGGGFWDGGTCVGHRGQLCSPVWWRRNTWGAAWWGWTLGKGVGTVPRLCQRWPARPHFQDSSGPALRVLCPRAPSVTHRHPCPCSPPTDPSSEQRVPGDGLGTQTGWERGRVKVNPPLGYFALWGNTPKILKKKKTEVNSTHTYIFITQINRL